MNDTLRRMPPPPRSPTPERDRSESIWSPDPTPVYVHKYGASNWRGYSLWAYTVDHVRAAEIDDRLRLRGAEGWELTSAVADLESARASFFLFFKRRDGVGL